MQEYFREHQQQAREWSGASNRSGRRRPRCKLHGRAQPQPLSQAQAQSQSQSQSQSQEDGEEDAHCCVCLHQDSLEDNPVIFCEGRCGLAVHQDCYNLSEVPQGAFYCDGCAHAEARKFPQARCVHCSKSGGMLRKSRGSNSSCASVGRLSSQTAMTACPGSLGAGQGRRYLTCSDCKQPGAPVWSVTMEIVASPSTLTVRT